MSERPTTNASATLRQRLERGGIVIAPGVYDMISAKLADRMRFEALYMTGYGTVASHLGLPDAGLASYTDMVGRVATICGGTTTPLVADADTGYGGLLNVRHTVRGYEKAGAQAIQIEDQETPKKCGHTTGRRVVPTADMVAKVKVAVEARASRDTLIIARTDARTALGLDEDQVGARTPEVPSQTLQEMGYKLAIYPSLPHKVAVAAMKTTYEYLQQHGTAIGLPLPLATSPEMHSLMGFEDVWAFEKTCERFAEAPVAPKANEPAR